MDKMKCGFGLWESRFFQTSGHFLVLLGFLLGVCLLVSPAQAKPRPPYPPTFEQTLYQQRFDNLTTNRVGACLVSELITNSLYLRQVALIES